MTLKVFLHSRDQRAETNTLLDSGATENFIHPNYAQQKNLLVKTLLTPHQIVNVDGTRDAGGEIKYYVDLEMVQGTKRVNLRFFLTSIGECKIILGYPWFAAIQPNINWAQGWITTKQLPVILQTPDAHKVCFVPRQRNVSRQPPNYMMHLTFVMFPDSQTKTKQTLASQLAERKQKRIDIELPEEYQRHHHIFSEKESQCFLGPLFGTAPSNSKKGLPVPCPERYTH